MEFGRENAATVRVYGGQNYANAFNARGETKRGMLAVDSVINEQDPLFDFNNKIIGQDIENPTILSEIENRLGTALTSEANTDDENKDTLKEIWQIDGTVKVFLQYVNRVPYLHIDGEIDYRQPLVTDPTNPSEQRLVSIPYKQLRRVISTQLHYFDHPMFGMLIEIRRFKTP